MAATIWPAMTEYVAAVQTPANLLATDLSGLEVVTVGALGLPAVASGRNAVVFHAVLNQAVALRCFTSSAGLGRDRYLAFEQHLLGVHLEALTPARWIDDAVLVASTARPAVVMPWVDGISLSEWVGRNVNNPERLRAMAISWEQLMRDLRSIRFAHGDLQHGNILITDDDELRLVDFDGIWVPETGLGAPDEWGHPNYQHPDRGTSGAHGEHIDWFSALVIHVSLLALAADASLWSRHNEENLIFTDDDFRGPSEIWSSLEASPDALVRTTASLLARACGYDCTIEVDLALLLANGLPSKTSRQHTHGKIQTQPASTSPPASNWWAPIGSTSEGETTGATPNNAHQPPERQRRETGNVNSQWSDVDMSSMPPPHSPGAQSGPSQPVGRSQGAAGPNTWWAPPSPGSAAPSGPGSTRPPSGQAPRQQHHEPAPMGHIGQAFALLAIGSWLTLAVGASELPDTTALILASITGVITLLGFVMLLRRRKGSRS